MIFFTIGIWDSNQADLVIFTQDWTFFKVKLFVRVKQNYFFIFEQQKNIQKRLTDKNDIHFGSI